MADRPEAEPTPSAAHGFEQLYEHWHDHVARWVRAMAGAQSDDEDIVQEVFLAARRGFARFDGRNPAGWLYKIAKRRVLDHRRSAWFVHLIKGREDVELEELPTDVAGPQAALERREQARLFQTLIDGMSLKRRTVFVLYEVDGYSGEEIAALEGIAVNAVWVRLHHARKDFFAAAAKHERRRR